MNINIPRGKTGIYACEHQNSRGKNDIKVREDEVPEHIVARFGPPYEHQYSQDKTGICACEHQYSRRKLTSRAGKIKVPEHILARFAPPVAAIRHTADAVSAVWGASGCVVGCVQSVVCSWFCVVGSV